jgi:hypothetical protein
MEMRQIHNQPRVDVEVDANAILRHRGHIAQHRILCLLACIEAHFLRIGLLQIMGWSDEKLARVAINDNGASRIHKVNKARRLPHRRNAKGACNNGDMAGLSAFFEDNAAYLAAVIIQELGRPHIARNNNGIGRQIAA